MVIKTKHNTITVTNKHPNLFWTCTSKLDKRNFVNVFSYNEIIKYIKAQRYIERKRYGK